MSEDITDRADLISAKIDKELAPMIFSDGGVQPANALEAMEIAKMMSISGYAVRPFLRNNPGACLAVVMQAKAWSMSAFAVAQKIYIVNDQFAYEAQLLAALVLKMAPLAGFPKYEYLGEGAALQCVLTCRMRNGEELSYASPKVGDIKPKNSPLWQTDPRQQLGYYSIRSWARRHVPYVLLGVYDADEMAANFAIDVTPPAAPVVERLKATVKAKDGFDPSAIEKALEPEDLG